VSRPGAKLQDGKGRTMLAGSDAPLAHTEKSAKYGQHQTEHNRTVQHNFVSFYFTNVPDDISYSSLRKGFKVCGIMEDVYLARKRNVNGAIFGFVRYTKVKDVDKLLKAVNNFWFGECKVVAKVSSFDRYGNKHGEGGKQVEGEKIIEGEKRKLVGIDVVAGGNNKKIEGGKRKLREYGGGYVGGGREEEEEVKEQPKQLYVPKYMSATSDMLWASKSVMATVLNGEVIPILQRWIYDAGFEKLDIIPLGADKVIVRSPDGEDVSAIFSEAPHFFNNFFSTLVKWNKNVLIHERGAWVRIYGVTLHAWNINFFKLCVLDCGRLLKVDDCTLEKERFNYARVLLSIALLEVINVDATLMVDDVLFNFKIIEEWGFKLGEDACLFDEDDVRDGRNSGSAEVIEDGIVREDVKAFVNHLFEEWAKETHAHVGGVSDYAGTGTQASAGSHASAELKNVNEVACCSSSGPLLTVQQPGMDKLNILNNVVHRNVDKKAASHIALINDVNVECEQQEVLVNCRHSHDINRGDPKVTKRTTSCPPGRVHSVSSVPWSLKWISRQKNTDKFIINKTNSARIHRGVKKKGCGALCHNAQSLKRIARLLTKERHEVLRALRKTVKKRRGLAAVSMNKVTSIDSIPQSTGSQVSVNNDCMNWLVLHENKNKAVDDVCEIRKVVGLKFKGDNNNMFDVLSGAGRENKEGDGGGK